MTEVTEKFRTKLGIIPYDTYYDTERNLPDTLIGVFHTVN